MPPSRVCALPRVARWRAAHLLGRDGPIPLGVNVVVLTPVAPSALAYLSDLAASFAPALSELPSEVTVSWHLQLDGQSPSVEEALSHARRHAPASVQVSADAADRQRGAAYTRTVGLLTVMAQHPVDVVLTIDADDVWLPAAVRGFTQPLLEDDSVCWVAAGNTRFSAELGVTGTYLPGGGLVGRIPPGTVRDTWLTEEVFPFAAGCSAYRAESILEFGGWPSSPTGEDAALLLAVSDAYPGWSVAEPLFGYRTHPLQTTQSPSHARLRSLTHILMRTRRR